LYASQLIATKTKVLPPPLLLFCAAHRSVLLRLLINVVIAPKCSQVEPHTHLATSAPPDALSPLFVSSLHR